MRACAHYTYGRWEHALQAGLYVNCLIYMLHYGRTEQRLSTASACEEENLSTCIIPGMETNGPDTDWLHTEWGTKYSKRTSSGEKKTGSSCRNTAGISPNSIRDLKSQPQYSCMSASDSEAYSDSVLSSSA